MANPDCDNPGGAYTKAARMHNDVIHDAECDCVLCTWISYQNFDPNTVEIKGMQKVFGARCKYERPPRNKASTANRQASRATPKPKPPVVDKFSECYTIKSIPVELNQDEDSNTPVDLSAYSSRCCQSPINQLSGMNLTEQELLPGQRIRFTPGQLKCLKDSYFQSKRPTRDEMQHMALDLGVKERSVKNWFKNRRAQERSREKTEQMNLR